MTFALDPIRLGARSARAYNVLDDAGRRVGAMRKTPQGWMLSLPGQRFVPSPGSTAAKIGIKHSHVKGFATVAYARKFLRNL